MYNVQDYSLPYNNVVRPVICEDLHSTHTWEARAWPHHFTANHLLDMNSTKKRTFLANFEVFFACMSANLACTFVLNNQLIYV